MRYSHQVFGPSKMMSGSDSTEGIGELKKYSKESYFCSNDPIDQQ